MTRKGQASFESTVAFVLSFMLLMAGVSLFMWFSRRLAIRQFEFEVTRGPAGRQKPSAAVSGFPVWNDPVQVTNDPNDPDRLRLLRRSGP